ncbi:MAG: ThuA domain-containing protein [Acidobacteriota bacterium]|nr:ThuA domain-containing protein [Acidobacteriota bacterium]
MRSAFALLFVLSTIPALAADQVIVVTVTEGFRHDSIPTAERVITDLAPRLGFEVTFLREESDLDAGLSAAALSDVKAVMFVNTTGDLPVPARESLLAWIAGGGSFIGVHSASDTWHEWPQYIEMLGGEFDHHPDQTARTIFVDNALNPATATLPPSFVLFEEYYVFKNFERNRVTMLLSLRASPENSEPGLFPLAWTRNYGHGRVFYTALGHRTEVWTSEWFQQHVAGAIAWGLRRDLVPRRRTAGK